MKHHLFLQGFAAAVLAFCTACAADWTAGDTLAEPQPLVFTATQGALTGGITRAATNGTWEGGEQVAIQIDGVVKKYIVDESGALTPDGSTTPFYRTGESDLSVTAWYPYSPSKPSTPTIATDQRNDADYEGCNLMTTRTTTASYDQPTALAFYHQTARLRFYLTGPDSSTAVTGATVKVTIGGSTYTAHEDGKGYYSVLVAPGTKVTYDDSFVSITTTDGVSYEATAPKTVTFTAGSSYNYDFALKRPPYLTFTANQEQGFKMTRHDFSYGTFEYSVGNGAWQKVVSGEEVSFGGDKGTLRLRGISHYGTSQNTDYCTISFTNDGVPVAASGDIRTLVNYKNYDTEDNTGSACFRFLFYECTALETAPELNATALATNCYYYMFYGCTGLKTAPKELPATELAMGCYNSMFKGCTALTSAPKILATKLAESCCYEMFSGCTALTSAPELPATELATNCYYSMFTGCTALTSAPELPATALVEKCYYYMFGDCSVLNEVTIKAEGTIPDKALFCWLYNVASTGTIHKKSTLTLEQNSSSGIPKGWTAKDDATD